MREIELTIDHNGLKVIQYNTENGEMTLHYGQSCAIKLYNVSYKQYMIHSRELELRNLNQNYTYVVDTRTWKISE